MRINSLFCYLNSILWFLPSFMMMAGLMMAAAYQVGLSFLTTHMRRAVAACTSPEVFFGAGANNVEAAGGQMHGSSNTTDPLGLAMDALSVSASSG